MDVRAIAWVKERALGLEFADISLHARQMTASGVAVGTSPLAYRLDYKLETTDEFITSSFMVTSHGDGWSRTLYLRRASSGTWSAQATSEGTVDLPAPGGDAAKFADARDCDLALSPLTNTMPVLRHGLLEGGGPIDFVVAWVSVPDLCVRPSYQRYTFVRKEGELSIVRYENIGGSFVAEITFDSAGLVVEYPGLGRRV
jgi:uncharacterized protein